MQGTVLQTFNLKNKGKVALTYSDPQFLKLYKRNYSNYIQKLTLKLDKETYEGFKNVLRDISKTHNQMNLAETELRMNTFRKPVKVFI